ncbi:hypothetical protein C7M56_03285 [Clostridium botulinum]|uniref:Uncharacterized protein n=1 Tax=Clostridium botulinum TaxID=1491 RepID=A0ABC8CQ31_CLOBO|nr:hypothetical protein [Clostridium botulinum]AVQ37756.1 hypothetical protein C7M56_03285 [Clostridium botulinum]
MINNETIKNKIGKLNLISNDVVEEVRRGIKAYPSEVREIRILNTDKGTISGYFNDEEKLLEAIKPYNGKYNIFVTINEVSKDLLARSFNRLTNRAKNSTGDSDIRKITSILIDIDSKRPSGISSTDNELKEALKTGDEIKTFLYSMGFPNPIMALSGNGKHLVYRVGLENNSENKQLIKNFLEVLHEMFSNNKAEVDRTTFNPARISKLYGTIACKGDSTPERPHRQSKVLESPENIEEVTVDLIKSVVNMKPIQEEVSNKSCNSSNGFKLEEFFSRNNIEVKEVKPWGKAKMYIPRTCPWSDEHDDGSYIIKFPNGAISAGCHHNSCSEQSWKTLREKYEPKAQEKKTEYSDNNSKKERKSQADVMIELAIDAGDKFFHDDLKECYVALEKNGNPIVYRINERDYKSFLVKRFFKETKKAPSKDSINQAIGVLQAIAQYDGEEINIAKRCAEKNNTIYYDLGDGNWTFIKITQKGWEVDESGQILFIRRKNMKPQVMPERYEDISIIDRHYRFKTKEDRILHTVSLVTKFLKIGNPITVYHGEKGASKTTTMRMDRNIVDPSVREVISMPKSTTDLSLVLHNNYVPCIDNIDNISAEKSDILCTAATGGGFSRRKLFTDDEETIYEFKVPVILNGINVVTTRPDLLDRSLLLGLERIPEEERKEERKVWQEFERDKPKMLGAIFHTISKAMGIYPTTDLKKLGRMADFTRWGYAIAEACGIGGEIFLKAYLYNQYKANDEAVSSNPIATAIIRLMETTQCFEGTPSKLLETLNSIAEDEKIDIKSRLWAKEPNVLTRRLNELKSNFLMEGITFSTTNTSVGRKIEIRKSPKELIDGQGSLSKEIVDSLNESDLEAVDF